MKRNNDSENHADGPKETFRSRLHQQHPEVHINLWGKQQGLDTGSEQSTSQKKTLLYEKTNVNVDLASRMGFEGNVSVLQGEFAHDTLSVTCQDTLRPLSTVQRKNNNNNKTSEIHLQTNLQLHQSTSTGTESINDIPGLTCHAKLMQRNLHQTAGGWIIALLLR